MSPVMRIVRIEKSSEHWLFDEETGRSDMMCV